MKFTILALALIIVITACSSTPSGKVTNDEVRIGVVLPLTGANSFYGQFAKPAVELAEQDLNSRGTHVRILLEDSASDQKQAASAAMKLMDQGVDGIITFSNPPASVIAPLAEENGIPFIYASSVNSYAENKTYVFKEYLDARDMCRSLVNQAQADGHKRIALFGTNAEFTYLCRAGIEMSHPELPSQVEYYNVGDKDFRTQIAKIKESESTALIVSTFANDCPLMFKQMKELQYTPQLYISFQSFGCGNDVNSRVYESQLQDAYGADIAVDKNNAQYVAFRKELIRQNATAHVKGSALMYDMIMEMADAYSGCETKECATKKLNSTKFSGLTGDVQFVNNVASRTVQLSHFKDVWQEEK